MKAVVDALLAAAKALSSSPEAGPPMPKVGSINTKTARHLLEGNIDSYLENLKEIDENTEFTGDPKGPSELSDELEVELFHWNEEAWNTVVLAFETVIQDIDTAHAAAADFWTNDGSYYVYMGVTGHGISLHDAPNRADIESQYKISYYDIDDIIERKLKKSAHKLENVLYNEATAYVDANLEDDEDEDEAPSGPEHDDIVYRYSGSNASIAGASAKGMYVAKLSPANLAHEGRELGHCIGNRRHGHPQLCKDGNAVMYSIRTETGRQKFTVEQVVRGGKRADGRPVENGTVTEIKGKANRLPGFEPDKSVMTKPDEVRLVVDFLINHLKMSPSQVSATQDIRAGVLAMQANGQDPFSPPRVRAKPQPPSVQAKLLAASENLARFDYRRYAR